MSEFAFRSAVDLLAMLDAREIGARELLEHYLDRVERLNPAVNAIIWTDVERARSEADAADARRRTGVHLGPLDGLPVTVKESFDLEGAPTTWGVPRLRNSIASSDAEVVRRYREAGAVVFGKTNVPLMLTDWQSFNDIYGTTNNPWDLTRSPGGSSGGSAAALAAGFTALEAGSDIGASIRNPAHYCGVCGHKPTHGIVSGRGQALHGRIAPGDIAVVGPMARSARDLGLAMDLLAGPLGPDARGWSLALPPARIRELKGCRVALIVDDPVAEVDRSVQDLLTSLGRWLEGEGASVELDARPTLSSIDANEVYLRLLRAATSKGMSDAEREAARAELATLKGGRSYRRTMLEAQLMSHREWFQWNERRWAMMADWEGFFRDYDVLLCPAAASAAFPHDQTGGRHERLIEVNGHRVPGTDQLFWAGYTGAFFLPATVVPIGLTAAGLPVGVQIAGRRFDDLTTLKIAEAIEDGFYRFVPPPGY